MYNIIESFRQSLNDMLSVREMDSAQFGKELGIDASVVRRWRNNAIDVRLKTLIRFADFFKCSIEYLCGKTHEYNIIEKQATYQNFGERL